MVHQTSLEVHTRGRGSIDITREVQQVVSSSGLSTGTCTVFIHHTSASLVITENADPDVRRDLETWMAKTVRDGDPDFVHDAEGADDMSAHVRSVITQSSLTLPVRQGHLDLGTWQGVFLWEHRARPHTRRVSVTLLGDRLDPR